MKPAVPSHGPSGICRSGLSGCWLLLTALVLGCSPAAAPVPQAAPGADAAAQPKPAALSWQAPAATPQARNPAGGIEAAGASDPALPRPQWVLEVQGELERADGRVERSYRVTLHNGAHAQHALLAQVSPRAAEVQVLQGTLVLGEVPAGQRRSAQRSLTLLQPAGWQAQADDLVWTLSGDAALHDSSGALLPGLPDQPAQAGLRHWQPALPEGWRIEALVHPQARVEQVNRVLRRQQLRIAQMRPGNHTLLLYPTQPPSATALQRGSQALLASGAFERVRLRAPPLAAVATAEALDKATDPYIPCAD